MGTLSRVGRVLVLVVGLAALGTSGCSSTAQINPSVQILFDQAAKASADGKTEGAQAHYEEALSQAKALGDELGMGIALLNLGNIYSASKNYQKAGVAFNESAEHFAAANDPLREALALYTLANQIEYPAENYERTITLIDKALSISKDSIHRASQDLRRPILYVRAGAYRLKASSQIKLRQFNDALDSYRLAISDQRSINDLPSLGLTLWLVGDLLRAQLKQPASSIGYYTEAIPVLEAASNFDLAAAVRLILVVNYLELGSRDNFEKALQVSKDAVRIAEDKNLTDKIADSHFYLALSFESLGDYEAAIEQHQIFLKSDRNIAGGDYTSAAYDEILETKAKIYRNLSRYEEAIANYRALLIKRKQTGDEKGQALALTALSEIYSWIGDSKTAIQSYKEALELFKKNDDTINEINVLSALGEQLVTGQIRAQESSEYFATADKLLNSVEGLNLYPTFIKGIANRAPNLDTIMQEQLRPFPPLTRMAVGNFFQRAARVIALSGNFDLTRVFLSLALAYHGILPPFREATIAVAKDWYFYAEVDRRKKLFTEALKEFSLAEQAASFLHSPEIHWVYAGMARTYEDIGDYQNAIAYYKKGLDVLESIHEQQGTDEIRIGVFAGALYAYGDLVPLLLKLHQQTGDETYLEEAFQTTERLKARAFREMFALSTASHESGELREIASRSEKIRLEIRMINGQLEHANVKSSEGSRLLDRLEYLQRSLNSLSIEEAKENPAYGQIFSPAPISLDQVKQSLSPHTAVLEYTINDQQIVLWTITKEAAHYAFIDKTEKPILQEFLKTIREPLMGRDESLNHVKLGEELYRTFLGPAEEYFKGKKHLVIVPDGDFYYLPFEALIESSKESAPIRYATLGEAPYLIKRYEISYASSATVFLEQQAEARNKNASPRLPLIAFGDPIYAGGSISGSQGRQIAQVQNVSLRGQDFKQLEFAAEEVKRISSVWNISPTSENINLGERASVERVKKLDLSKYHILHFATHAVLGDKVSLASQPALVLSMTDGGGQNNGLLQFTDILDLKLNADLVVLSACDTGLGQYRDGEGILGLTRAFFYAGASSAIVSLWEVEDQSTALLMEKFYQRLKNGQDRAEAIRQAKLDIIRSTVKLKSTGTEQSLASPFFWAPFILVGDAGPIRFD